jgi:hypothetical protein
MVDHAIFLRDLYEGGSSNDKLKADATMNVHRNLGT